MTGGQHMAYERPAEAFPPGEYIKDELEARGWTQAELAEILGRPARLISELLSAKRSITPETAMGLSQAFGTTPDLWLNLESSYQLWKAEQPGDVVSRRARLYGKAPIKEMVARGWIEHTDSIDVLEREVLEFFEAKSVEDDFVCRRMVARKTTSYKVDTSVQVAWFCRAMQLSACVPTVRPFDAAKSKDLMCDLRALAENVQDSRRVPAVLSEHGIRLLVLAPLAGSRVDGVCFWRSKSEPVIALSLRTDTIDSFWFTLMHEVAHVMRGDGLNEPLSVDDNMFGQDADISDLPEVEVEANKMAAEALIPKKEFDGFVVRTRPNFYGDRVEGFAARVHVHPGIVNGQLHHFAGLPWKFNRQFHEKVRHLVIQSALTDGFGMIPPAI